jgi:NADH-quinone oxidoreductase subunit C
MGAMGKMADVKFWKEKIEKASPGAVEGDADRFGTPEVRVKPESLPAVVKALQIGTETALDMLVDLASIDYSANPGWDGPRFGLIYHFKSLSKGRRLTLKVLLSEEKAEVGTISSLYKNADWLEREAWDQMGIRFTDHPNLKRLLNHHEFVGHPLRKDYPITRRQWLTANQSLMDEMRKRLKEKGYVS